ncbi:MAG: glycosyltransferase family 39 protein [bacterium]|nr:glycosyltransferase family 39 protein [bacterium]
MPTSSRTSRRNSVASFLRRIPRVFWLLLLAGLALRVAAIQLRPEGVLARAPDEDEYLLIAQSIAHGDGFALRGVTTAYRDMLMPSVAGAFMIAFGPSALPMLFLNALLSCFTALLLFELGRSRFGDKIGVLLGGIWLFYPGAILLSALFFTETLFVFLWMLALVIYDRMEAADYRWTFALALGLVAGLAMLTRATGIVLLVSLVIYIGLVRWETPKRERWTAVAVMTGACLLMIQPWLTRNAIAVGSFSLNTNGGINFLIGNNPRASGSYKFDETHERLLPPVSAGEAARDQAAARIARHYLTERTRAAVGLWGKKFAYLWATDVSQWAHYFGDRLTGSLGEKLRALPLWRLLLLGVPYMMFVGCGIAGFYLVRNFPDRGLFLLQIFLTTMMVFVSFGAPRFHFPLMPAMVIGIGALFRPRVWVSAPAWRRLALLLTLGIFGGIWLFEAMTIAGV